MGLQANIYSVWNNRNIIRSVGMISKKAEAYWAPNKTTVSLQCDVKVEGSLLT